MPVPSPPRSFPDVNREAQRESSGRHARARAGSGGRSRGGGSTGTSIRIGLVDDHRSVRAAIRGLIASERGLEVIGEAETMAEALELIRADLPDVLLLDLGLRDGLSLPAIPALLQEHPGLAIIVLTMQDEPGYRSGALSAGASAYLLKDGPPNELVETIRASGPS